MSNGNLPLAESERYKRCCRLTNEFETQIDELLSTVGTVTRRLFHIRCLTVHDDPKQSIHFIFSPSRISESQGNYFSWCFSIDY